MRLKGRKRGYPPDQERSKKEHLEDKDEGRLKRPEKAKKARVRAS